MTVTRIPCTSGRTVQSHLTAIAFGLGVLLAALAVRWWLLEGAGWLLEADDALSALMAIGILEGERPLMLRYQAYAGAWQPYLMAVCYELFGASRVSARLPALAASLALVGTTWLLAREVGGTAAGRFAAVLMALPPVYIVVLSLKPWAPYTEVAVLGSLALWCATRLVVRRDGARDGTRALACGLLGGVAFWMHPLAVDYLVAIAALCLVYLRGGRLIQVPVFGVAGFVVGALPLWLYNVQTRGATVYLLGAGSRGDAANPAAVLDVWWHADLPRAVGLWNPWVQQPRALSVALALLLALACAWAVCRRPSPPPAPWPLDGPLLLLAAIPVIFVVSGFGESALNPWQIDATGRYTLPIWGGLAVVLGAFLATVWRWRRAAALGLAGVVVAANIYASDAADPVSAFQSPYWPKLPADNGPLLATLKAEGISYVWMNHWAALPVMLDAWLAGQPLVAYDWYDVEVGGIDRYPEYGPLVEQAQRPAYVLVTDEPRPELMDRLRELGVSYRFFRLPPYVVVLPTSRKVHPAEVGDAIDSRY